MLLKTKAYLKGYGAQTKWMYFWLKIITYWKKYNTIWNKVSADIKKEFDSQLVYNKKKLKTKRKFYGDEATDFHDKETPKAGSDCTCLAVITNDSAIIFRRNLNTFKNNFRKCLFWISNFWKCLFWGSSFWKCLLSGNNFKKEIYLLKTLFYYIFF